MSAGNIKTWLNPLNEMIELDYKELINLLYVQTTSDNEFMMYKYITDWLEDNGIDYYTDAVGNIIATKGTLNRDESYPCIAAHMDTVHEIYSDFTVYRNSYKDGNIKLFAKDGKKLAGIGGDDKNGIFAAFKMLEEFDVIKAVFFTKEEVGLIGSSNIDFDVFTDVGYVIQLDRWGKSDFINSYSGCKTVSDGYMKIAENILDGYGYEETEGLITDSINLFTNDVGISCVNVSCGYYQHHTVRESIDANELNNAIEFTKELIRALGNNRYEKDYEYEYNASKYDPSKYDWLYYDDNTIEQDTIGDDYDNSEISLAAEILNVSSMYLLNIRKDSFYGRKAIEIINTYKILNSPIPEDVAYAYGISLEEAKDFLKHKNWKSKLQKKFKKNYPKGYLPYELSLRLKIAQYGNTTVDDIFESTNKDLIATLKERLSIDELPMLSANFFVDDIIEECEFMLYEKDLIDETY